VRRRQPLSHAIVDLTPTNASARRCMRLAILKAAANFLGLRR
jgi:hypothetical protein